MLARNEEELELFNKIDRDRYEVDKRVYPHFSEYKNYRLIQDHEVPDWVKISQRKLSFG